MKSNEEHADHQAKARRHLEQAYAHDAAGEFERALRECEAAIELAPSLAEAHNVRALLLEELDRKQEALAAYRQALQLDPGFQDARRNLSELEAELVEPHVQRAYDLLVADRPKRALRECQAALDLAPAHAPAHNLRGIALEELGRVPEAAEAYRQALRLDPGFEDAAANLSDLEAEHPKARLPAEGTPEALVLEARPEEEAARAHKRPRRRMRALLYGFCLLVMAACLLIRFFSGPRNLLYDPHTSQQALTYYIRIFGLEPETAAEHLSRGRAHADRGEFEEAIDEYSQAIALDPQYVEAYSRRGDLHMVQGDLEKAVADFDQVIQLDPGNAHAYRNRGTTYYDMGMAEPAVADLSQVIILDPQDPEPYIWRAAAYSQQGQFEPAVADCSEALDLDPTNVDAYTLRGVAYAGQGKLEQAIADYTQAITLDPQEGGVYYLRGLAYAEMGELDRAISDLNHSLAHDPNFAPAFYYRGMAHAERGEREGAIADLNRFLELSDDPEWQQYAEEQLDALGGR